MADLVLEDFSGGETDTPLSAEINQFEVLKNVIITKNRKARTRAGSEIYDEDVPLFPASNLRINRLFDLEETLFAVAQKNINFSNAGSQDEVASVAGNKAFENADEDNKASNTEWNLHQFLVNDSFDLPIKMFKDGVSGDFTFVTAGLPALASSPTITPSAGGSSYLYAFVMSYEYTIGDVTFKDYGPVTYAAAVNSDQPSSNTVAITVIPVLANTTSKNYDTTNIKIEIYRSIANGSTLYYVGQVTNGTTSYNDTASDATVSANRVLYTDGGVPDSDPPPPAKYIHQANGITLYGHVKIDGDVYPNRVMQAQKDDPDAVPSSYYFDLDGPVTGVSSVRGSHVVFTRKKTYLATSYFDSLGRVGLNFEVISHTKGCVSNNSIVQVENAILFAGVDGFYFCDGQRVIKVSDLRDSIYKRCVQSVSQGELIYGCYEEDEERVWWAAKYDPNANDNDYIFIFDMRWGIKPTGCFTHAVGNTLSPSALHYFDQKIIRGHSEGYVFQHSYDVYDDPHVDTAEAVADWFVDHIQVGVKSGGLNCGTDAIRKWGTKATVLAQAATGLNLDIYSYNDGSYVSSQLKGIRFNNIITWGDPTVLWGDPLQWNYTGLIKEIRRFPASGGLRFIYKQIELTSAFVNILKSDAVESGSVNSTLKTVTLPTQNWPTGIEGYKIAFDTDDYEEEYDILSLSSGVLTYSDAGNNSTTDADAKWYVRGYKRGQGLLLESITLEYAPITNSHSPYTTAQELTNA